MTDIIDKGCEREQQDRDLAIAAARSSIAQRILPMGCCYNCEAVIDAGLFCDGDCRDDYERRVRRR